MLSEEGLRNKGLRFCGRFRNLEIAITGASGIRSIDHLGQLTTNI